MEKELFGDEQGVYDFPECDLLVSLSDVILYRWKKYTSAVSLVVSIGDSNSRTSSEIVAQYGVWRR